MLHTSWQILEMLLLIYISIKILHMFPISYLNRNVNYGWFTSLSSIQHQGIIIRIGCSPSQEEKNCSWFSPQHSSNSSPFIHSTTENKTYRGKSYLEEIPSSSSHKKPALSPIWHIFKHTSAPQKTHGLKINNSDTEIDRRAKQVGSLFCKPYKCGTEFFLNRLNILPVRDAVYGTEPEKNVIKFAIASQPIPNEHLSPIFSTISRAQILRLQCHHVQLIAKLLSDLQNKLLNGLPPLPIFCLQVISF